MCSRKMRYCQLFAPSRSVIVQAEARLAVITMITSLTTTAAHILDTRAEADGADASFLVPFTFAKREIIIQIYFLALQL